LSQADDCLIHTGSKEILDGICLQLHLDTDSMKLNKSYAVLENYGNLSSASTGFMLAGKKEWADPAMVVGFGAAPTRAIARNHSSPAARHSDEATMAITRLSGWIDLGETKATTPAWIHRTRMRGRMR